MLVKSVENIVNVQTVQIVHEILHKKKILIYLMAKLKISTLC